MHRLHRYLSLLFVGATACGAPASPDESAHSPLDAAGLAVGEPCAAHAECLSDACGAAGTCVARRSLVGFAGAYTCGPGEDGAEHESCGLTLPVDTPTGVVELDKYVVTAGRMRAFVERTGGDLRGFVDGLGEDARWDPAWSEQLPRTMDELYWVLGPFGPRSGCWFDGEGARTYWLPDAVNATFPDRPQAYGPDVLDTKAMQCVPFAVLQAFCIWDGGRLATLEEIDAAWGPAYYPWGDDAWTPEHAVHNFSYGYPEDRLDNTAYIAAPGRRPLGNGPYGHADLGGLVFQLTSTFDADGAVAWSRAGSWEVHGPGGGHFASLDAAYWAAGGRCTHLGL
jgi:formylglycine-generating enzyme required for sulfatase activity